MDRVTGYLTLRGTYLLQGFSFGTDQIRLPTSDGASHPSQGKLWTAQRNTITTWLQFERQELRPPFPTSSTHGKDTTTPKPHFGATRASPSQHQNRQDVYPRKLPLHRRPPHQRHRSPLRRPLPRAHQPIPLLLRPDLWLKQRRKRKGKDYQLDRQRTDTDENTLDRNQHYHHPVRTHPRIRCRSGL